MENLEITPEGITWERNKFERKLKYITRILYHDDHIYIIKVTYVNGEYRREDVTLVPLDLLPTIIEWVGNRQLKTKVCEHPWASVVGDGEMQPAKCLKCGEYL